MHELKAGLYANKFATLVDVSGMVLSHIRFAQKYSFKGVIVEKFELFACIVARFVTLPGKEIT